MARFRGTRDSQHQTKPGELGPEVQGSVKARLYQVNCGQRYQSGNSRPYQVNCGEKYKGQSTPDYAARGTRASQRQTIPGRPAAGVPRPVNLRYFIHPLTLRLIPKRTAGTGMAFSLLVYPVGFIVLFLIIIPEHVKAPERDQSFQQRHGLSYVSKEANLESWPTSASSCTL